MADERTFKFCISKKAYDDFRKLSRESGKSLVEILRIGLGLAKLVLKEAAKGNMIVIVTPTGETEEIILPK